MDAAQRLAWAVSVSPVAAALRTDDPRPEAFATFAAWFGSGQRLSVFLRDADGSECQEIEGEIDEGKFLGRSDVVTRTKGRRRTEEWTQIGISAEGIEALGAAGRELERRGGKWREVGAWATGDWFPMSRYGTTRADARVVEFRTYAYYVTVECAGIDSGEDVCIGGGVRTCTRCVGLRLVPHADGMAWGQGTPAARGRGARPIDCTQPCPRDEWTSLIEPVGRALAGHTFYDDVDSGVNVYATAKACRAAAVTAPSP